MRELDLEWRKTMSTPVWWVLTLALVLFVGALSAVITLNMTMGAGDDLVTEVGGVRHLAATPVQFAYSFAARTAYAFPFLFGALLVTEEYRHRTLGRSVLTTGSRAAVYRGKVGTALVVAMGMGVLAVLTNAVATALVLRGRGLSDELGTAAVQGILSRTVLAYVLWALIGVGLGALLANQVVTVVVVLMFTLFIEPTLTSLGNENPGVNVVARFLPGAASLSLAWPPDPASAANRGLGLAGESLGWWQGGLTLLAYVVVLLIAGYAVRLRPRDILEA